MLNRLARPFVVLVEKFYPDALIFAILLTFVTFIMAFALTDVTFLGAVAAWGDGYKAFMTFTGQMAFIMLAGSALASTRPAKKLLIKLANLPKNEVGCYVLTTVVTIIGSLIAWPVGLIGGGIVAKYVQYFGQQKGLKIHFPLLVAAAYSGWATWEMGYTGMPQLWVATPGNTMEEIIGGLIPVLETTFAPYNLVGILICLVVIPLMIALMRPTKTNEIIGFSEETIKMLEREMESESNSNGELKNNNLTFGQKLESMRWQNILFGLLFVIYLVYYFTTNGFVLTFDIVNWTLFCAGFLLADSPKHYVRLVLEAGKTIGPIIIQYPMYAGIMGIMAGSGLVYVIADFFVGISNSQTLGVFCFLSAGVLNLFIPSGGGQWGIQGPIFLEAAKQLNVPFDVIVNAVAYGDQWTNLIQPFWAIPLMAIVGLGVREVLGYCFVTLIGLGAVFSFILLVLAPMLG